MTQRDEKSRLIEDILNHLSQRGSCHSAQPDTLTVGSSQKRRPDGPARRRPRKLSYQGDYSTSGGRLAHISPISEFPFFEQSKVNFREIMQIRKEMGIYLRKSSTESNINVNSLINYVHNNQALRSPH